MPSDVPTMHPTKASNTCRRIFKRSYNELKHEVQRDTNYQFGATGLLENITSTAESSSAKMKGVMCL